MHVCNMRTFIPFVDLRMQPMDASTTYGQGPSRGIAPRASCLDAKLLPAQDSRPARPNLHQEAL